MLVQLFCFANRGKSVATSAGLVPFDADGYATVEATDDAVAKFRALRWLMEKSEEAPAAKPVTVPSPVVDEVFDKAGVVTSAPMPSKKASKRGR